MVYKMLKNKIKIKQHKVKKSKGCKDNKPRWEQIKRRKCDSDMLTKCLSKEPGLHGTLKG